MFKNKPNSRKIFSYLREKGFKPERRSGQTSIKYNEDLIYSYGPDYIRVDGIKKKDLAQQLRNEIIEKFGYQAAIAGTPNWSNSGTVCDIDSVLGASDFAYHLKDLKRVGDSYVVKWDPNTILDKASERFYFVIYR
jgi:hypothetical protein